jgi:hypothetical protein
MDETRALEILGDTISKDGGLYNLGHYTAWNPGSETATLDCEFTADELEAIAWWMRNFKPMKDSPANLSTGQSEQRMSLSSFND